MKLPFQAIFLSLALCGGCSKGPDKSASGSGTSPIAKIPQADLSTLDPALKKQITALVGIVEGNATSADGWGRLGEAYQAADFLRQAEICYSEAARLDPASGKWRYLLALLQINHAPDEGFENLARAVTLLPRTNDFARLALGKSYAERGRATEAAAQFQQILATAPEHPGARLEMARLELRSNNIPATLQLLQPCLTNSFTAKPALLLLSQAKQRAGRADEALALARKSAAMAKPFDWPDPILRELQSFKADGENLRERANGLLMQGRLPEAEKLLGQLLSSELPNAQTALLMGRLKLQQRACGEAEEWFQKHLQLQTNSLQGWVQLGLAQFCQSSWDAAALSFQKAIQIKPDFAQAHYNLGLCHSRARRSREAIAAYQNALRSQPGDAAAHAALAEEHLQLGNTQEAAAETESALMLDPRQPRALRVKELLSRK
jgi:tetratricopeptide (TPR) repeat protein